MSRKLSFKGSHREIGIQVGEQYKKWGKKEVLIQTYASDYYPGQLAIYEKYYPQYLEYLKGIASGLGLPEDNVLMSYLTGFLPLAITTPVHKCSAFALRNTNGILIGRNYDWLGSSELISSLLEYQFTDGSSYSFTGITDMATWEVGRVVLDRDFVIMTDDAWNEHGLYVTVNGAPGKMDGLGLCVTHLIQCIAEKCKTTNEAIELIKTIPISTSKIFTIADKQGSFAVVEKPLGRSMGARTSRDIIFTTNHFNHPDLTSMNLEIFKNIPFHSTFSRYHYLEYNLEKYKDNLDIETIISLLSKPPAQQNWRGVQNGDIMTIWTYGLNLTTGKYAIDFAPIVKEKTRVEN